MGRAVTRVHIYEAVYRKVGLSRVESGELVELVLEEICNCLEKGEEVKLSSFGAFLVSSKRHRVGRNPKTGEEVAIAPRNVMAFKASAVLKKKINEALKSEKSK